MAQVLDCLASGSQAGGDRAVNSPVVTGRVRSFADEEQRPFHRAGQQVRAVERTSGYVGVGAACKRVPLPIVRVYCEDVRFERSLIQARGSRQGPYRYLESPAFCEFMELFSLGPACPPRQDWRLKRVGCPPRWDRLVSCVQKTEVRCALSTAAGKGAAQNAF